MCSVFTDKTRARWNCAVTATNFTDKEEKGTVIGVIEKSK
jgi:hypothetical protein